MKHLLAPLGVALALLGSPVIAHSAAPPNILLITADDLGLQLSCYGEQRISTPTLDSLASQGTRFSNAYVAQASCSSSRSSLLTGLWPHQNGQLGLSHLGFTMTQGLPNLPALLKDAGYTTGIIGKLHVEPAADFPFDWMPDKVKTAGLPTRDVRWVAEQSRKFFANAKESGKPFFYYVNFFDPHGPCNQTTDQVNGLPAHPIHAQDVQSPLPLGLPSEEQNRTQTAHILNTVLRLDDGMKLLLQELQDAGVADHTIVVFVGDNGPPAPRGKTTSYEFGVRVPMIVRWPGLPKAQVKEETVSLLDLMPTLLDAAGAKHPDTLTGSPLQPLLRGDAIKWREYLFTEMNFHSPDVFTPQRSVRDPRYKLLLNLAPKPDQAPVELFDLKSDPDETRNLADDPTLGETKARLQAALDAWRAKRQDPLLDPARLKRWETARERWSKLPRKQAGPFKVVTIPEADLELLR